ncbi:MAG: DPP IV N-terminal domain-containing protein [Bacteroidales bacterium]|nr:DPP IV N-terminal domain-containing protein [Bacteroidales bacterium]
MISLLAILSAAISCIVYSPDSTKIAYTLDNDLYVKNASGGGGKRLTFDGSATVLNGRASWVYYEEIFGRSSNYSAIWWSPDSRKIAFCRFDESAVGEFPIARTGFPYDSYATMRYPKTGTANPSVKIGIVSLDSSSLSVWASIAATGNEYLGTPFWSADSRSLYVQRMTRRQNELFLYRVIPSSGAASLIGSFKHVTWVDFIEKPYCCPKGFYFVRPDETGWEQIYYMSDTYQCKKVSSGRNMDIKLLQCNEKTGEVIFLAKRDSPLHPTLYHLKAGKITILTDPSYWTAGVEISADGSFVAAQSSAAVPWMAVKGSISKDYHEGTKCIKSSGNPAAVSRPKPEQVCIKSDGYELYGLVSYPENFSEFSKYPVVMQVYGGPGISAVHDVWGAGDASDMWCYRNGIIYIVVDPRSAGQNGRRGVDEAYGRMCTVEVKDYISWAKWLQSKPYVKADRIGVRGFSFGGTTTATLVLRYPEYFRCGIAGAGVYDWRLYDTCYTERYMNLPEVNPDGYAASSLINIVKTSGVSALYKDGALKLTHGCADDNVHLQNTLLLAEALQECGARFEMMLYPGALHGYKGSAAKHSDFSDHDFWKRHLLEK